jgi:hypothetical protein
MDCDKKKMNHPTLQSPNNTSKWQNNENNPNF